MSMEAGQQETDIQYSIKIGESNLENQGFALVPLCVVYIWEVLVVTTDYFSVLHGNQNYQIPRVYIITWNKVLKMPHI